MSTRPLPVWIASAAARLASSHGGLTRQAGAARRSRQAVAGRAQKGRAAVAVEHAGGPTHPALSQEREHPRREEAQLRDRGAQAIAPPRASGTS